MRVQQQTYKDQMLVHCCVGDVADVLWTNYSVGAVPSKVR